MRAALYDRLTALLERRALARWRALLWRRLEARLAAASGPVASNRDSPLALPSLGLEIGVGTGANLAYHPEEARIVAVDRSEAMLRGARARLDAGASRADSVWLVVADAAALPFPDATFAWAAETFVFCEVGDPVRGLSEIRRVIGPAAPLLMLEHVRPRGWRGAIADALTRLTAPVAGEHLNRDPEALARRAGFAIVAREWVWSDVVRLLELVPAWAEPASRAAGTKVP